VDVIDWIFAGIIGIGISLVFAAAAMSWWEEHQERRRNRIEHELDLTSAKLRATILELARALSNDAHEARKALIQESFDASREPRDSER
jgi:hypothetical protein